MNPAPPEQVSKALQEVLSGEEFEPLRNPSRADLSVIGELANALFRAVVEWIGDLNSQHPAVFIAILLAGVGLLAIALWYGARGAARRAGHRATDEAARESLLQGDPAQLSRAAQAAAQEARYLDAVRLMFRAKIIEQALAEGILERLRDAEGFRRGRTYRELVEEFTRSRGAQDQARGAQLAEVAQRLELGMYAGEPLLLEDWEKVQRL